ncbi:NAD(P)/FAD-dependent oxidoreductase [Deinococcus peraridilitoris]|nr:FAD-dependent oxidoreductase [Deinococcus peraridilitoris]
MHDVIVVGAGLGGLACARDLARSGRRVLVLDKSRGVSGRAATRRREGVRIDHGAQYFTARSERLQRLVDSWQREGWLRIWTYGFPLWERGQVTARPEGHPRFAPLNGMSALGHHLARDLEVLSEVTVSSLARLEGGWKVYAQDGSAFQAASLVLNLPAPQLSALVTDLSLGAAGEQLDRVRFDPTWTLLVELQRDLPVDWPAVELRHEVLSWLSRDHTKRASGALPTLVAHASGSWSRAHLEEAREEVEVALLAAVQEVTGEIGVRRVQGHRWRYATPTVPFGHPFHWDPGLQLGWCGDWCGGARVEGALESGWGLAQALRASLTTA